MTIMPMKIVTINIPDQYLDCIETMVNLGFFPSRSEAVREALKQFLTTEADFNHGLEHENFEQMKRQQLNSMIN
jgi:Arc/MetJ-type ribon-helix-helix transcriptional regulator